MMMMKRTLFFSVLSLLWIEFAFAAPNPNPDLIAPNGGTLTFGKPYLITWNYSGTTHIKLVLWQNGTYVGAIVPDLPATVHSYSWNVGHLENGATANAGAGYKVRVRTIDNGSYDDSSQTFTIAANNDLHAVTHQPATPIANFAFEFIEPTGSTYWTCTQTHTIRWKILHKVNYPLELDLVLANQEDVIAHIGTVSQPARSLQEDQIAWTIPATIAEGQYRIRLSSAGKKAVRLSSFVRIHPAILVK